MFNTHWADRKCGENYSAVDGQINDQADTDSFYTWGRSCRLYLFFRLRAGISGVLWKQADDSKPPAPRDRHATCVRQPGKPLVCAGVGELRHDRLLCLGNCHRGNR